MEQYVQSISEGELMRETKTKRILGRFRLRMSDIRSKQLLTVSGVLPRSLACLLGGGVT